MDLVGALLRVKRVDEALEVSDKMRGRALREHLVALEADSSKGGGQEVQALVEQETILRRIDALQQRLDEVDAASASEPDSMSTVAAKGLSEKLAAAREQYEGVVVRVEQLQSGSRSLLGGTTVVAAEVRRALRPGEALIEYLVTPTRLIAFVVSPSSVRAVQASVTAQDLAAHVRVAIGLMTTSALSSSSGSVMHTLHEDLFFRAVRSEIPPGTHRLVIVPHSILSYVPFAALRDGATGRYLVEDFDILRLPSAAALPTLRHRKRDSDATGVGFRGADLLAPFPINLPGTLREARSAARSLPGANVYVGDAANEPRLRSALNGDGLVHVATHGVMNARNPMFSRIELSRGNAPGSADDGHLEVHEVLRLRVSSPLVFLSGCETGAGAAGTTQWSRGEDYATLAQAFLYAGTRDVIATLWQIQDDGAADFAGRFYGHLRSLSSADALAETQREMIRDPRFSAPYYWASYVISGEGLSTTDLQNRQASSVQLK
jgi:CHAT domain-containing protein